LASVSPARARTSAVRSRTSPRAGSSETTSTPLIVMSCIQIRRLRSRCRRGCG
jgi:hypothetical protein